MIPFSPVRNGSHALLSSLSFKDFEVSWAGPHPREDGFCFGSDDGRLLFTDSDGTLLQEGPEQPPPSGEAINGVAFIGHWMAVSTRKELRLFTLSRHAGERIRCAELPVGAHGIIASASGHFFAPLGRSGILFCKPKDGPEQTLIISSGAEEAYIYRLVALRPASGGEIIACAARGSGVAAMEFKGQDEQHTLSTFGHEGLDVVDLCPLGIDPSGRGIAAVGKDRTIVFFRDVLTDRNPIAVEYPSIEGTAYRLLSKRGYLFLLTSAGLYVIARLINHFLNGSDRDALTPVLAMPMEAVDAYVGGDRWVLIVMPDGVLRFDVELLERNTPIDRAQGKLMELRPTLMNATWKRKELLREVHPVMVGAEG